MICAIDFGCSRIRSVYRNPQTPDRLTMYSERSEYTLLKNTEQHRTALESERVPYAECRETLVIFGNNAAKAQWLSRVPRTALLTDGLVPSDDAPARQMLNLLTESIMPKSPGQNNICVLTIPGVRDGSLQANRNEAFLCHLVQMRGYTPVVVNPAEAALLATCSDVAFTGVSIVMGAETTTVCVARLGVVLASETIAAGGNWIDSEMSRQFKVQMFDETGNAYLDLESIRQWKIDTSPHLMNAHGDRERQLSRLYSVVQERIVRSIRELTAQSSVRVALNNQRLSIMAAGGAVKVNGFADLLTEQLIQHDIADRILAVKTAPDSETAVLRGTLIYGELECSGFKSEVAA